MKWFRGTIKKLREYFENKIKCLKKSEKNIEVIDLLDFFNKNEDLIGNIKETFYIGSLKSTGWVPFAYFLAFIALFIFFLTIVNVY